MQPFKILVSSQAGANITLDAVLMTDFAAIRRAKAMASTGDTVEVWRGPECIFRHEQLGALRSLGSIVAAPFAS